MKKALTVFALAALVLLSVVVGMVVALAVKQRLEPAPSAPAWQSHRVKEGEDLYVVALLWAMSPSDLKQLNNLTSEKLEVGQVLKIPPDATPPKLPPPDARPRQQRQAVAPEQGVTPEGSEQTHTVKAGEDIYTVAVRWNVSPSAIKKLNNLTAPDLEEGQVLKIPSNDAAAPSLRNEEIEAAQVTPPSQRQAVEPKQGVTPEGSEQTHTVKAGEDVYSIAVRWGVSPTDLKAFNKLTSADLQVGQVLIISRNPKLP